MTPSVTLRWRTGLRYSSVTARTRLECFARAMPLGWRPRALVAVAVPLANNHHLTTMNTDDIVAAEAEARQKLEAAQTEYARATRELRQTLGDELRAIRKRTGRSREAMAALIDSGRGSVFAAECPDKAERWFTVARLLEMREAYLAVERALKMIPSLKPKGRGRPKKTP